MAIKSGLLFSRGRGIIPQKGGNAMARNVVHIFGPSGSGTTSLGRSRVKHDQWQTLLPCQLLRLDGAAPLEENFQNILPLLK